MDTTEEIIDLDRVVMQAWKSKGIGATRQEVERRLKAARRAFLQRSREEGHQAYAWGYAGRKSLQTPVGDLGPIRIPRMRVDGKEVRLIPKQVRRIESLDRLAGEATILGISQRRVGRWLLHSSGESMSAATVGRIVLDLSDEVEAQRRRALHPREFEALAVDGVYGKYRGRGDAVLVVAMGVRWDGSFDALDWEAAESESGEVLERLFGRLYDRGLIKPSLLVGDGAGAVRSAKEMVYPAAEFQLCLWHWSRTLKGHVSPSERIRFSRDFWEVYNALDRAELGVRVRRFKRYWRRRAPEAVRLFEARYPETVGFMMFPERWRHRVRTVNLAEGFFKNFRRFFNRFPGFKDEEHLSRAMGLYLLGAKPERWRPRKVRLVA